MPQDWNTEKGCAFASYAHQHVDGLQGEDEEQQPQKHKASDGVGQSQGVLV